jgi:Mlc titration factor MtfA (ptsG expression regulator)
MSALVMFLNDDGFMSLRGLLWAEETSATLFYELMVVILKLESEFLKGLDVVYVYHINP